MSNLFQDLYETINSSVEKRDFSGTAFVTTDSKTVLETSGGYANRSDELRNTELTRFGIASGCKIFTAVAICQLVERGQLSFDSRLKDCVDFALPDFDADITIHHLLTHTAGIPDYYDEEVMDTGDFEELWRNRPMYHLREPKDFLPLFESRPMKFAVGSRFSYNNAGYILLGLVVEAASQQSFADYVQKNIFDKAGMHRSGYFDMDALPQNTAYGYIDFADGTWKTNIYSLPAKGGPDGGAFVTVHDMVTFWDAFLGHRLLNHATTQKMLTAHTQVDDNEQYYYGYGVWMMKRGTDIVQYYVMGYDPGVSFHSAYYPSKSTIAVVCSNKSSGAYDIMKFIDEALL